MNAASTETVDTDTFNLDPLLSPQGDVAAIADLAFGNLSRGADSVRGRHLALLPADSLELDLSDPAQSQFGDYELLELIGEGGMGVVYRARQASLDREVAVKLLAAGPWASREFIERFRREAQNAARMQHPNIVAIYEVGHAEELHFFSMRLIRGPSVAAMLKRDGKLSAQHAATLLRTIAEAVDYAHRLGVLHLDLKPANVLLDENGTAHVADFGLARRLEQGLAADNNEVSGTPSYMAPEQALLRSQKITPATDIWGLGAILYELVTGQPPFLGESAQATLKLVVGSTLRSPRELVPNLPRDLEAIIVKCMAHEAAERYSTARALADDLARFIEHRPVLARPLSAPQRAQRWAKRQPYLAAFAALFTISLIAGIVGVTSQWRRAQGNAELAATSATLASERLWQARIDQAAIAVRDGHSYDALPGLAANIKEREAQGLDAREDRIRIAAVERSAPRLIDAIAMGAVIYGVAISPDGKSIAVATDDEKLHLLDAATGIERWQTSFHAATHFLDVSPDSQLRLELLRFTADGRYLIGRDHVAMPVLIAPTGFDEVLFDVASGKALLPPASAFAHFRDATYSPDGAYAIVRSTDQHANLVRTSGWQPLGAAQPFDKANPPWLVTTEARHVLTAGDATLNIHDPLTLAVRHVLKFAPSARVTAWVSSPDGNSVVIGHFNGEIERVDCASGHSDAISPSPIGRIGRIAFSPDGRWFGTVADSGEVLVWDSATLRPAAPLMHLNTTPEFHRDNLLIDAEARTVIASIDYEMGLWYLPDDVSAPVRLMGESPNASAWWMRTFAYDAAHGLIATDGGQGELRLWRVQQLAPRGLHGSPLPAQSLHVGSGHIVAVDGNVATLLNAADGRALGPALKLPSAVSYADMTADDTSLVVLAGHELFVYDAAKWTMRRAPIQLPNDPARLFLNPDSRHTFVLFADYADGVNREVGQIWDLLDGTPTSALVPYPAQARFSFSADGRNLLTWAWMDETLQLVNAITLQARWPTISLGPRIFAEKTPGAGEQPIALSDSYIAQARFSADDKSIDVLLAGDTSPQNETNRLSTRLWQFDATSGRELRRTLLSETGGGESFAIMPDRRHAIIQRPDSRPLWWDEAHGVTELAAGSTNEFGALALAADASMFARAAGMNIVALTSTSSLQWLTPSLPTAVPTLEQYAEHPTQLAITRDGSGLIGRTRNGEWLYWDISPDLRPLDKITRESALLNPDLTTTKASLSLALSDSERQALRAVDPGPPLHIGGFPQHPIPERQPGLAANLVDLGAFYNKPLQWTHRFFFSTYRELAAGTHRFYGVDYDVRGVVALSMKGFAAEIDPERPPPSAVRGIHPGVDRFAALNLLMAGYGTLRPDEKQPYAIVELDYRDGSRERLPIVNRQDTDATFQDEEGKPGETTPRVAWRATNVGTPIGYTKNSKIYSVRIVNPHPEREVASLALNAVDQAWSTPLFFAITAEPLSDAAISPISSTNRPRKQE